MSDPYAQIATPIQGDDPYAAISMPAQTRRDQGMGLVKGAYTSVDNASNWLKAGIEKSGMAGPLEQAGAGLRSVLPEGLVNYIDDPKAYYDAKAQEGVLPGRVGEFVGNMIGAAPAMAVPGGVIAQSAAGGALLSDKKDLGGVAGDAFWGGLFGKGADLGLNAIGKGVSGALAKAPKVMSPEQLVAAVRGAYQKVDDMGVKYTPQAMRDLVEGMRDEMVASKINPKRHPKAASMMEDVEDMIGQSPTLTEIDQLRQVIGRDVAGAMDDSEGLLGGKMIKNIDEFLGAATPRQVVAGDPQAAATAIREARDMASRSFKTEAVQEALTNAGRTANAAGSGANVDNRTRQEMIKVLRRTNNFTPDEEAAIVKAIDGSKGQNFLRGVGKMSPLSGGIPGISNALGGLASTAFPGGPAIAGTIMSATTAAKLMADAITKGNADDVLKLIAVGGKREALKKTPTPASRTTERVVRKVRPGAPVSAAALAAAINDQ